MMVLFGYKLEIAILDHVKLVNYPSVGIPYFGKIMVYMLAWCIEVVLLNQGDVIIVYEQEGIQIN